jgi:hypothetical protein
MTPKMRSALVVLSVVVFSAALAAQRGGGRGRGGGERPATPTTFDSQELGISFAVPSGLQLYTPEAPGRFKSLLSEGRFLYLTSSSMRNTTVSAKYSSGTSDADLKAYRQILDTNPPQAKLPGFKKHRVRFIKIGKNADQEALDYEYDVKQNDLPVTIRQVVFVRDGKGFTFTCTSLQHQFGEAEATLFGPLFSHLEFR